MKAGIIAAGIGERLTAGGDLTPKPLVSIGGEPMIGRLIRLIAEAGIASLCCIINEESAATGEYLLSRAWPIPLQLLRKTTDNSMESLFSLAPLLEGAPFALFTVDAVFRALTLKRFLAAAAALPFAEGVLALTRFCDDEKPLRVAMDRMRKISRMGETRDIGHSVTAGFYRFEPSVFDFVAQARARGLSALRQFLCFLLEAGYGLYGISAAKTIDVDRPEDVVEAENYLKDHEGARNDSAWCLPGENIFSRQG
jgi:NDP-sugar pyrophosphorylase family protein